MKVSFSFAKGFTKRFIYFILCKNFYCSIFINLITTCLHETYIAFFCYLVVLEQHFQKMKYIKYWMICTNIHRFQIYLDFNKYMLYTTKSNFAFASCVIWLCVSIHPSWNCKNINIRKENARFYFLSIFDPTFSLTIKHVYVYHIQLIKRCRIAERK